MIADFFKNLSYRANKENDLSDVTWAMCHTSPTFKEVFLKFFFDDIHIQDDLYIDREIARDDSRPDFVINNGNELYLIENKIYDTNHHFGQYEPVFDVQQDHFDYIANYVIPQPQGGHYPIRTWEDFFIKLGYIHTESETEQSLIDGYRVYLANVCNINNFSKPMNIKGIYSLYQFVEILRKLCSRAEEKYSLAISSLNRKYNGRQHADHFATGILFHILYKQPIKDEAENTKSKGWIGIYFNEEIPTIAMSFVKGTVEYDIIQRSNGNLHKGDHCANFFREEDGWFAYFTDGSPDYRNFDKLDIDGQSIALKSFMDEVLTSIIEQTQIT